MTGSHEISVRRNPYRSVDRVGYPWDNWTLTQRLQIPLSTKIPYEKWTEITQLKAPDLSLAHYLASQFVAISYPIPARIKDAIVMRSPAWARDHLNQWNRNTGHLRHKYPLFDEREAHVHMAIAASAVHGYLPNNKDVKILENYADVLLEMSWDLGLIHIIKELGRPVTVRKFQSASEYDTHLRKYGLQPYDGGRARSFVREDDGCLEIAVDTSFYLQAGIPEEHIDAIVHHERVEHASSARNPHLEATIEEYRYVLENFGPDALRQYHTRLSNLMGGLGSSERTEAITAVLET